MRSRGRYSSRQRRLCFSRDSWRAEQSGRRSTPPHTTPPLGSSFSSPSLNSWHGDKNGGGGELEAKGDPSGARRESVAVMRRKWGWWGGMVGWGGGWGLVGPVGGFGGLEIRFATADDYSRVMRLPAELSSLGVSKTFCQTYPDMSVRHTHPGVCTACCTPVPPPHSQSGSSAGPSLPVCLP